MSKQVVLFGLGEFAAVADVYLTEDSPHDVVAYTVHEAFMDGSEFQGRPVVPFERLEERYPPDEYAMFVAIGFKDVNRARAKVYGECKARGYELVSYVCSKATHWSDLEIGDNTFVFENNVIQPFTKIGSDVVIWSGNHIGHHVVIGDHCFLTSHVVVSGGVVVGDHAFLGVNATIRDHVTIAPSTVVGAGALVMKDTEAEDVLIARRTEASGRKSSSLGM